MPERLGPLDMLRGVAALLVMAGHLRAFVFRSYAENPAAVATLLGKAFYFASSFGHQAVLAFFALSGFLVGGKALSDLLAGPFNWTGYLSRRLTRLWLVILPALALTFVLDRIGISLTGGAGYNGRWFNVLNSGPRPDVGVDHSVVTLLGNVAFIHTISVPIFGSNGPMWSFANEFWYYVVFPLAAWLVLSRTAWSSRVIGAVLLASLVNWLPQWLLAGGLIWVAGAAAAWSASHPAHTAFWRSNVVRALAVLVLIGAIVGARLPGFHLGDLAFGVAIAAALPTLALMPSPGGIYRSLARAASELSYTLYLTHFLLLTLIALVLIGDQRFVLGATGAVVYAAMFAASVLWAALLWWCFERNTDRLYRHVRRINGLASPASVSTRPTS